MTQPRDKRRIFIRKEYRSITGNGNRALYVLTALFMAAFAALVMSKASLEYLEERMNDPFVSWITVEMNNYDNFKKYDKLFGAVQDTASPLMQGVEDWTGAYGQLWNIWPVEPGYPQLLRVRSFNAYNDSLLLSGVTGESNLLLTLSFNTDDWRDGIILSQSCVEQLTGKEALTAGPGLLGQQLLLDKGFQYPLRILAVVKSLPRGADILCAHGLMQAVDASLRDNNNPIVQRPLTTLEMAVNAEAETMALDGEQLLTHLAAGPDWDEYFAPFGPHGATIAPDAALASHAARITIRLDSAFEDVEDLRRINRFWGEERFDPFDTLQVQPGAAVWLQPTDYYPPNLYEQYGDPKKGERYKFDNLSFKLSDLQFADSLRQTLERDHNITFNLDQIETQRNFYIFSVIAQVLVVLLTALSIVSVILYLRNLMTQHLQQVKAVLGTLMAFGLSRADLLGIYLNITVQMLVRAAAGTLIGLQLTLWAIQFAMSGQLSPLATLFGRAGVWNNAWVWWALAGIFAITILALRRLLHQFLSNTPSDLLYDR